MLDIQISKHYNGHTPWLPLQYSIKSRLHASGRATFFKLCIETSFRHLVQAQKRETWVALASKDTIEHVLTV